MGLASGLEVVFVRVDLEDEVEDEVVVDLKAVDEDEDEVVVVVDLEDEVVEEKGFEVLEWVEMDVEMVSMDQMKAESMEKEMRCWRWLDEEEEVFVEVVLKLLLLKKGQKEAIVVVLRQELFVQTLSLSLSDLLCWPSDC